MILKGMDMKEHDRSILQDLLNPKRNEHDYTLLKDMNISEHDSEKLHNFTRNKHVQKNAQFHET